MHYVVTNDELPHKGLIDEEVWDRLIQRMLRDTEFLKKLGGLRAVVQNEMSQRILNETLGFLRLCSLGVGSFTPSEYVDIGWHSFILSTREYAEFCDQLGGFIHHQPADEEKGLDELTAEVEETISGMIEHGIAVNTDRNLWRPKKTGGCCGAH